jgi:3-deoxy-D-manno-octulosonate 8-phosphate phosphatase KdsC-like HAD superfamily phosphatase
VNGWFGTFDKLSGWSQLVAELGEDADATRWAFVGDSGNDAPMFAHFDVSVGVANVDAFLDRIPVWPAWRAGRDGGYGFADFVRRVLELRR